MSTKKLHHLETLTSVTCDKDKISKTYLPMLRTFLPQQGTLPSNNTSIRLQAKAIRAQKAAEHRLDLLDARNNLYKQNTLPDILPDFSFYFESANLKDKLRHYQSCLQKVFSAQEPLSNLADFTTYFGYKRNELLTVADIEAIKSLQGELNPNDPLYNSIQNFLNYCENTLNRKTRLLSDLSNALDWQTSYEKWNEKAKMKLLVQAEQILSNPYEPKFSISDLTSKRPNLQKIGELINSLKNENTASYFKNDFWDYVPELERKAYRLAQATSQELLLEEKVEGLKAICRQHNKNDEESYLVVGAGPAGLMQAISLSMQQKSVKIIEKRKADRKGRCNTVTFGKWNPQELKILLFLGTLSRLEAKSSFGHNRAYYTETSLNDLEVVLEETLHSFAPHVEIQNETTIKEINPDGSVKLTESNSTKKHYTGVIAADGAHSSVRNMLGIGYRKLSHPLKLAFSTYKRDLKESSASMREILAYRITNAVKGVWIIIKILFGCVIYQRNILQSGSHVYKDGPSGLSRLSKHDYLLTIFRQKEQMTLEKYQDNIAVLKHLGYDAASVEIELKKRLVDKSKALHGPLDFIHTMANPKGHRMRPIAMVHDQTHPVDVMIGKAERNQMQLGHTLFTIRGDASHTTDPYSGTGAKTAIEETVPDYYFFSIPPNQRTALDRTILEMGFQSYQDKMFKGAFAERFDYYRGTETPEWFSHLALSQNFITEKEQKLFLKAQAEKESGVSRSMKRQEQVNNLKDKCLQLAHLLQLPASLKSWEKKLVRKAIENPDQIDSNQTLALNKLCCLGHPLGPLLQIAIHL